MLKDQTDTTTAAPQNRTNNLQIKEANLVVYPAYWNLWYTKRHYMSLTAKTATTKWWLAIS